eukprot:g218.t1
MLHRKVKGTNDDFRAGGYDWGPNGRRLAIRIAFPDDNDTLPLDDRIKMGTLTEIDKKKLKKIRHLGLDISPPNFKRGKGWYIAARDKWEREKMQNQIKMDKESSKDHEEWQKQLVWVYIDPKKDPPDNEE